MDDNVEKFDLVLQRLINKIVAVQNRRPVSLLNKLTMDQFETLAKQDAKYLENVLSNIEKVMERKKMYLKSQINARKAACELSQSLKSLEDTFVEISASVEECNSKIAADNFEFLVPPKPEIVEPEVKLTAAQLQMKKYKEMRVIDSPKFMSNIKSRLDESVLHDMKMDDEPLLTVSPENIWALRALVTSIFPVSYSDKFFQECLNNDLCRVIYKKRDAIAIVAVKPEQTEYGDVLYVRSLGVHPLFREKGIGARLLNFVDVKCREKGLQVVMLHVQTSNTRAIEFYEKRGYSIDKLMKNYYHRCSPPDAFVMLKRL
ncbi:unnamed protein product [Caenorhabditis bovis]|uniref:N-terminal methionine N(alpha)-acetyltransferase NatE n=1 Tax=Caenorhabditis bovis TaxID=2654633 RepID=A0A8S1EK94_9PELO|nr:unnamed protein product [Caenorhabditis bovis]